MKNKTFDEYKVTKNNDGTLNILKVPIAMVGERGGIVFSDEVIKEIINNHRFWEDNNNYPPVIFGSLNYYN